MEKVGGKQVVAPKAKRKQAKSYPVIEQLLARNAWNPFERVDPRILERVHKQHEQNARKFLLANFEEAPF